MDKQNKLDFYEIENILMCKQWEDLLLEEKKLLKKYIGNQQQVKAYQLFLEQTSLVLDTKQTPELKAKPAIQQHLRQQFNIQHQKQTDKPIQKNSLEQFCLSILSIFTMRHPLQSGLAMAVLVLAFWCGNHFHQQISQPNSLNNDSIALHITDTASLLLPADSSDSDDVDGTIFLVDSIKNGSNSFYINAILRR